MADKKYNEKRINDIRAQFKEGKRILDIAKHFNMPYSTVYSIVHKLTHYAKGVIKISKHQWNRME